MEGFNDWPFATTARFCPYWCRSDKNLVEIEGGIQQIITLARVHQKKKGHQNDVKFVKDSLTVCPLLVIGNRNTWAMKEMQEQKMISEFQWLLPSVYLVN